MITTESYGCDKHGEDAYQGCAMCDLEALRKDAERYRWLRIAENGVSVTIADNDDPETWYEYDSLRLDAAIDAFLAPDSASGPKCERCGDTGWIQGDPVAGISDEPCGCEHE
jgi:hypothetical protein